MIHNKELWHFIYDVIKYSDYELFSVSDEIDITLKNKRSKELLRIVTDKQNIQSTQFLTEKMSDHLTELSKSLGFNPKRIQVLLINQDPEINLKDGIINVMSVNDIQALKSINISKYYQWLGMRQGKQSENYYKKRVINPSYIDLAMIKFAPVTSILIILNVLIYLINLILGNAWLERGGLTHFNFVHGDIYRIVTAMFLHFDFTHILFNMMSLYIFGKITEYIYHRKIIWIYLFAGLFGNLVSLSFDTLSTSVGASGAISGLMGALLAYIVFSGKFPTRFIIQMVAAMIIFLLVSNLFSNVNNWAHFGGLFGGFFIASTLIISKQQRQYLYYLTGGAILIIGILLYLIFSQPEKHIYNIKASNAMAAGNFKEANQILKEVFDYGYANDETYVLYGTARAEETSLNDAIEIWKKGLKEYPNSSLLNYQMAVAMRAQDNYDKADAYLKKAKANGQSSLFDQLQKELEVYKQ